MRPERPWGRCARFSPGGHLTVSGRPFTARLRLVRRLEDDLAATRNDLAEARDAGQLLELMAREVDHRAKNTLTLAIALLQRQASMTPDPAMRGSLETAGRRLTVLARVHSTSHAKASDMVPVRPYLHDVCGPLATDDVIVKVSAPDEHWPTTTVAPLGLLASEAVMNAVKHAFPDERRGRVLVRLSRLGPGRARLAVKDDGVGFSDTPSGNLGLELIRALTRQLSGHVDVRGTPGEGCKVTVEFPVAGHAPSGGPAAGDAARRSGL